MKQRLKLVKQMSQGSPANIWKSQVQAEGWLLWEHVVGVRVCWHYQVLKDSQELEYLPGPHNLYDFKLLSQNYLLCFGTVKFSHFYTIETSINDSLLVLQLKGNTDHSQAINNLPGVEEMNIQAVKCA